LGPAPCISLSTLMPSVCIHPTVPFGSVIQSFRLMKLVLFTTKLSLTIFPRTFLYERTPPLFRVLIPFSHTRLWLVLSRSLARSGGFVFVFSWKSDDDGMETSHLNFILVFLVLGCPSSSSVSSSSFQAVFPRRLRISKCHLALFAAVGPRQFLGIPLKERPLFLFPVGRGPTGRFPLLFSSRVHSP